MLIAATFGLIVSLFLALSGDESAHQVALKQPVKLAAMEGLYEGKEDAGIVAIGILNSKKSVDNDEDTFHFEMEIPYALSLLGYHNPNAFVPGLKDLVYGNEKYNIESAKEKIAKGKIALEAFKQYKKYEKEGNTKKANDAKLVLESYVNYFGYGYLDKPTDIIPPIALTFYSFHIMVALGGWFILLFAVILFLLLKKDITKQKFWLYASVFSIPLGYIAAEAGWIVAEVGRQPWAIQDLMPVGIAATNIATTNVQITFFLFAFLFTALLIAELKIMAKQIKIGPNGGH
jgi:cytochrome d ubiquinol oxidase subunit I